MAWEAGIASTALRENYPTEPWSAMVSSNDRARWERLDPVRPRPSALGPAWCGRAVACHDRSSGAAFRVAAATELVGELRRLLGTARRGARQSWIGGAGGAARGRRGVRDR